MSDTAPASRRRRLLLTSALGCLLPACGKEPAKPAPAGWLLTPGAPPPDWSRLEAWQGTVTRDQFVRLLEGVLTDGTSWFRHIEVREDAAQIRMATPRENGPRFVLRFASPGATASAGQRYWRRLEELPALTDPARPLDGLHIALDPGHIGGSWAQMEERWYQSGGITVREGDLTLRTARILAPMLEALGARVSLVRKTPEPMTKVQPEQLMDAARASLAQDPRPDRRLKATDATAVKKEAERLFYRTAEIRARGALVNETLRPDLVLCLHFNGSGSSDPARFAFSPSNHLHVLAHGCLDGADFGFDDQRLDGLLRLVQGIPDTEIPLCVAIARRMTEATGLPAFTYRDGSARMVDGQPYVWMRNLLANRIYQCPVAYLEPYVADNQEVFERIKAGDYEGTAPVAGKDRPSIFREYAGGVTAGLRDFFAARRGD